MVEVHWPILRFGKVHCARGSYFLCSHDFYNTETYMKLYIVEYKKPLSSHVIRNNIEIKWFVIGVHSIVPIGYILFWLNTENQVNS